MKQLKRHSNCFIVLLIFILLVVFIGIILNYAVINRKPDNNENVYQVVNKHFSEEELKQLETDIYQGEISLFNFKLKYRPQCIRETFQGEYAILLGENDERLFVFWAEDNRLYATYNSQTFLEKKDFESIHIGETQLEDVLLFDKSAVSVPFSLRTFTGHITKDGVFVIEYDKSNIVLSMDFYSNDDLLSKTNEIPIKLIPYILPQDKQ